MDPVHALFIATAVREIEDLWGHPLSDLEKDCVLAGYAAGLHESINVLRALRERLDGGDDVREPTGP